MLEKPRVSEEEIIGCLRDAHQIDGARLEFLPLGADNYTWVYRVRVETGLDRFLKLRGDAFYEPSLTIPRFLHEQGIAPIVTPIPTLDDRLWVAVGDFALTLYPYIEGQNGMEVGLSDSQWTAFGAMLKAIHAARPPDDLLAQVRHETFVPHPKWAGIVRQLAASIPTQKFDDPHQQELAAFWMEHHTQINRIVDRCEALGRSVETGAADFVVCHADIHTANLLITPDAQIRVVDWDEVKMAPKERDLMFVTGSSAGNAMMTAQQEARFFDGYGQIEIDKRLLAYYRYEWVVQDLGAWAEPVFLTESGDETKAVSVRMFRRMFAPGDVIEAAYQLA